MLTRMHTRGHILVGTAIAATVLMLAGSSAARNARACVSGDLMPAYEVFVARTTSLAPEARADAFADDFAPLYPQFYAHEVFGDHARLRGAALKWLDVARRPAFPGHAAVSDADLERMSHAIHVAFPRAQRDFLKTFPDFRCHTYVAFGPSLSFFDGHTYTGADGRERLLFGVDLIALIHQPADMPAFFDHELFHLYHTQMTKPSQAEEAAIWWNLWREGLATYVSRRMHPDLTVDQVLWVPSDLAEQVEARKAEAARALIADLDAHDDATNARWFQFGGGPKGLPVRSGYYLGYLLAEHLGKGRSLRALARMKPETVHAEARAYLNGLAAQK